MVIGHCHRLMDFAVCWLWTFARIQLKPVVYLSFVYRIDSISIYIGEMLPYKATNQVSAIDIESQCGWIRKRCLSSRNSATLVVSGIAVQPH